VKTIEEEEEEKFKKLKKADFLISKKSGFKFLK
jgi:hypothetical protein